MSADQTATLRSKRIARMRPMNHRCLALASFVGCMVSAFTASSAIADGYSPPPEGYAAVPFIGWTGFYIGGHVGGAWSTVDWANVNLTGERVNNDARGFIGGGQIGYNQQFGVVVLGAEAMLSGDTLSDDFRSLKSPTVTYSTDVNTITTVTGRLGVAAGQWLVYAKAGWAGARVDVAGHDTVGPDSFSLDQWRNGWTAGTGLEYKVARNIGLGLEYSFIDLGSQHYHLTTTLGAPVNIVDHDVQVQSVTGRLNLHF
jgi:outer membrane immunogenic protein